MEEIKPYQEQGQIRTFSKDLTEFDLVWHRDREDRIIEPIEENDWKVQLDNQLPVSFNKDIFIPKGTYHRLLAGTKDLKLKLTKIG